MSLQHIAAILALASLPSLVAQDGPSRERQQANEFRQSNAWKDFTEQSGGDWLFDFHPATGTPNAIWGTGLAIGDWREDSLAEARRHANDLLRDRSNLLGLGTSEFREVIGGRMGKTWALVYDQYFRGLEVIDGRADVRIHEVGRVAMFGSKAFQVPADFSVVPGLLGETATAIAWQSLDQTNPGLNHNLAESAPRLVIWGDVQSLELVEPALAWEVAVNNFENEQGRVGRYYIDAHSGAVLHFIEDRHLCAQPSADAHEETHPTQPTRSQPKVTVVTERGSIPSASGVDAATALPTNTTVTVNGWLQHGVGYGIPSLHPLAGIEVSVSGFPVQTTDANGQFTINISGTTFLTFTGFRGRHFTSIDGAAEPVMVYPLSPGNHVTFNYGGIILNDLENAHNSAAYWVDHAHEYCRNILGNTGSLSAANNIDIDVNQGGCGSSSYSSHTIKMANGSSNCFNASFSSMIMHEWGHELDKTYGGIANQPGNGLGEAWGDIISMFVLDDPRIGLNYYASGAALRTGNNLRLYTSLTPTTPVHDAGEVFMGFAWKFRELLGNVMPRAQAISISNDVVIGSVVADATNHVEAVLEAFVADDDDGNLWNGTPHDQALISACVYHALPYPMPLVNDDCSGAIAVTNGVNGPFDNTHALSSSLPWGCTFSHGDNNDLWFSYTTSTAVNLDVTTCGHATWSTMLELYSGTCGNLVLLACNNQSCGNQSRIIEAVPAGTYLIRVGGNGTGVVGGPFSLEIDNPPSATSYSYGYGCGKTSKSFYELIDGLAFDLNGMAMTLVNNGNYYTAQSGGTFLPPSASATTLPLSINDEVTVTLSGAFPYHGGTTSSLIVCSNGFVSAQPGNGTGFIQTMTNWLTSSAPRWGSLHWFDVISGGAVKFEQIGTIAYVTWDGTFSYGTSNPNTWQLQFDLATGNVTYVWDSIIPSFGDNWLIGYASGTYDNNVGERDISMELPGTFHTSPVNGDAVALSSTPPVLGTTCALTTTNVPPTSFVAIQALSLTQLAGINMAFLGMPGCWAYTSLDAVYTMPAVGGQATYDLTIPNQANLIGFQVFAQTTVFAPTINTFGFVNSNGLELTLDY